METCDGDGAMDFHDETLGRQCRQGALVKRHRFDASRNVPSRVSVPELPTAAKYGVVADDGRVAPAVADTVRAAHVAAASCARREPVRERRDTGYDVVRKVKRCTHFTQQ